MQRLIAYVFDVWMFLPINTVLPGIRIKVDDVSPLENVSFLCCVELMAQTLFSKFLSH